MPNPEVPEQHPTFARRLSDAVAHGFHLHSRPNTNATPAVTHTAMEPMAAAAAEPSLSPQQQPIQFCPPYKDPVNPFNTFHLDDPNYQDLSRQQTRLSSPGEAADESSKQDSSVGRVASSTGATSPAHAPTSPRLRPGLTHVLDSGDFVQDHVLRGASWLAHRRRSSRGSKSPPTVGTDASADADAGADLTQPGAQLPKSEQRPPWAATPDQIRQWREEDRREIQGEQEEYAAQREKEQQLQLQHEKARLQRQRTALERRHKNEHEDLLRAHTVSLGTFVHSFSHSRKGEHAPVPAPAATGQPGAVADADAATGTALDAAARAATLPSPAGQHDA